MDGPIIRSLVRNSEAENTEDMVCLTRGFCSFDSAAEETCERLINLALETDKDNAEALQTLASVRLSQQRPDEARQCLERAWSSWKDLDPGAYPDTLENPFRQLTTAFFIHAVVVCVA